jgi:hypothetical protein
VRDLKAFDRQGELPPATDIALLEHSATRRAWQFAAESPPLKFLRVVSRRWPKLTFFLYHDCEDGRVIGLVQAKRGRLHQQRYRY